MKRVFVAVGVVAALQAQSLLDSAQTSRLNHYNHRFGSRFCNAAKMRDFAKITPKQAHRLASEACRLSNPGTPRLKRKGRLLFYDIAATGGYARINALDGAVISCPKGAKR
ncbi:hypothetical protein [Hydrogenimonas sp.]